MVVGYRLFLLVLAFILVQPFAVSNPEMKNGTIGGSNNEQIYINGDENLTQDNGVTRGSGTSEDPFVIENRTITAMGGTGISISYTTKHIIINNCTLIGDGANYGINLYSVKNITIQNCSLDMFNSGIDLWYSINISISNCSIKKCNWYYIHSTYSKSIIIDQSSNVNSIYMERTEDISILDCDLAGFLALSNVNNVSISKTEASKGFFISFDSNHVPIFYEFDNNTVRGKPVWFSIDEIISPPSQTIGQILFINLSKKTFSWTFPNSIPLIELVHCSNLSLEKIMFLNSTIGMNICDSISFKNCTLNGTILNSAFSSFESYAGCLFIDCFLQFGSGLGLNIINCSFQKTRSSEFEKCLLLYGFNNISISRSSFGSLIDIIKIDIQRCNEVSFTNSSFNSATLVISEGNGNSFHNNTICCSRIDFEGSHCNSIKGNSITGQNYGGISFYYSYTNEIIGNLFNKLYCGIRFIGFEPDIIISHNYFIGNEKGISFSSSGQWMVYNNYFDNNVDVYPDKPTEYASIVWTKKEEGKKNIVNGPNIGGNYWAKYEGLDIDYDGFGDTNIPYGPGDEMPLIDLRKNLTIEDLTHGKPYTGDLFEFDFKCPPIYPWVATGYRLNISYYNYSGIFFGFDNKTGSIPEKGMLTVDAEMPVNASFMAYQMVVEDNYGDIASLDNTRSIIDWIPPSIRFIEQSPFLSGKDGWLRLSITDNFALKDIDVTIAYNEKDKLSSPKRSYKIDDEWMIEFSIPENCYRVMFIINATDVSGLLSSEKLIWTPVLDVLPPSLEFLSLKDVERCSTYDLTFRASDNFEVRSVEVMMVVDGVETELGFTKTGDKVYSSSVWIFEFQGSTHFLVSLEDYQGNVLEKEWPVILRPLSGPIIDIDPGALTTGDMSHMNLDFQRSNISLEMISCSFDTGYKAELPLFTQHDVQVPENARSMDISVVLKDNGGYLRNIFSSFEVKDNDPPVIEAVFSDPECGKLFWMETTYTDNLGLVDRGILYDLGVGTFKVLNEVSGRSFLDVPLDARLLNITTWAIDGSRNIAYKNISLKVHDGIPPSIVGIASDQYDGMIFITLKADDNLGCSGVTCHLVSPFISENMTFIYDGEMFKLSFPMMEGATNFSFRIKVSDSSGNSVISDERWLEIPKELGKDHKGKNFLLIFIFLAIFTTLAAISATIILIQVQKKKISNHTKNSRRSP